MKRFRLVFFFVFVILLNYILVNAQKVQDVPSEVWGRVDPDHLAMEVHEKDSAAEAVILFDLGHIFASYENEEYEFRHHKRIKLLKSSSLERGTIAIPFFAKSETIISIEAQAILPTGQYKKLEKMIFYGKE